MSRNNDGSTIAAHMAAVAILFKAPRTRAELARALDIPENCGRTKYFLRFLHEEGVIYVKEWATRKSPRYAWQPHGARLPDAPQPKGEPA